MTPLNLEKVPNQVLQKEALPQGTNPFPFLERFFLR